MSNADASPTRINANGAKFWEVNGIRHRDGGLPAVEWADGSKEWWANGIRHRDAGLPAVEWADGIKRYYVHGELVPEPWAVSSELPQ